MNNTIKGIIMVLAFIVCICSGIYMGFLYMHDQNQRAQEGQMRQEVESDTRRKVDLDEILAQDFNGERDGDPVQIPSDVFTGDGNKKIDFSKLLSYNKELIAWIYVEGTKIDYPVARHDDEDQSYYLNHDMYGEPSYSGCIYMERANQDDFTDNNTILYGHNMKNGTMFKGLHLFEGKDFFDQNRYIYIYLPDKTLVYDIFAAYSTDDTYILKAYDFNSEKSYDRYLRNVLDAHYMGAYVREGVDVTTDDKIITLSTCIGGQTSNRYIVQGVLKYERRSTDEEE